MPQAPRAMVRAELPKAQSLGEYLFSHRHHIRSRCHLEPRFLRKTAVPSARWTMTNEVIEGDEWATYGALETYHRDETQDHLRARAYGDRALIVLVRVTPHQGRRESRLQGEAVQVGAFSWGRARDMRSLNRRSASTGEPDDTETVLSGLGRG